MENFENKLRQRIEQLILPARKAACAYVLQAMADTFTDIGAVINVAELENSGVQADFSRSVCGLSRETLRSVASYNGMIEEWLEASEAAVRNKLLLEFIGADKMRMESFMARYPKAFSKWSEDEDDELRKRFEQGCSWSNLSDFFGRNENAIKLRLQKFGYDLGSESGRPRRA